MADHSTIGRGAFIRGSVRSEGDLEIQGRVEGTIEVDGDLTIAEGALIKSDLTARRLVIHGAVAGNVSAQESIVLEEGARVVGDLSAPRIGIRPGGLVRGNVSTEGGRATTGKARSTAAANARPAAKQTTTAVREMRPSAQDGKARAIPAAAGSSPRMHVNNVKPAHAAGPPPPVVPSLKKGAKGSLKRKGAR